MRPELQKYPSGTRLAFDENIGDKVIGSYARSGCVIVYVAPKGSRDEDWVEEAHARGAQVVLSWDLDIGNIIDRNQYDGVQWREP
jgi:hypothetical protein